jgi:hypothetical protein
METGWGRILALKTDQRGGDVARPLTPDELARYPWASQISDYVPVGRLRKDAVYCGLAGLTIMLIGAIISLAQAQNIHHAITMRHAATEIGVYGGMALTLIAAALGVVTAVQSIIRHGGRSLLLWSVAAIVPAVLVFLVFRPMIH